MQVKGITSLQLNFAVSRSSLENREIKMPRKIEKIDRELKMQRKIIFVRKQEILVENPLFLA